MADSLHVIACSTDRLVLRRLTRALESAGCRVDQSTQPDRAAWLLSKTQPDIVVVDSDLSEESFQLICRTALDDLDWGPPPVLLALIARHDVAKITSALAAGVDDLLQKPLAVGEVLARLRAAARLRQQHWRRYQQLGNSDTPGCLSTPAWRALAVELSRRGTGAGACVVIEIDHFQLMATAHGHTRSDLLKSAIVENVQTLGGDGAVWGELKAGCLAALLTSSDEVAALAWAERLRLAFAETPFEVDGVAIRLTLSSGVAPLDCSAAIAEEQALGALQLARDSGGDSVVSAREWEQELRRLADEPAWLDSSTAWDVMTPLTLVLHVNESIEQAQRLIEQTQLPFLPVVDSVGKLLSLVSATDLNRAAAKPTPLRTIMQAAPICFDEETPASLLQSFFAAETNSVVVVTRHDRPVGLVCRHSLALLGERLTRHTFAPRTTFSLDSSYLLTLEECVPVES